MNRNHDKRRKITTSKRKKILVLCGRGWVQSRIAEKLKCSQSTVSRVLRQSTLERADAKTTEHKEKNNES